MTRRVPERQGEWELEPVSAWARRWGVPHLEVFDSLPSTNNRLRALAESGAAPFTVVIAEEQTAGRGRHGRSWSSPPGKGLWISLLVQGPSMSALRLAPVLLGIAAARAVEEAAPSVAVGIKWPNDLFGRRRPKVGGGAPEVPGWGKVAGILCEAYGGSGEAVGATAVEEAREASGQVPVLVIAGIGINVRQREEDFPPELRRSGGAVPEANAPARPASLEMLTGHPVDRGRLGGALLRESRALLSPAPAALSGAVAEELRQRDILAGARVRLSVPLDVRSGPPVFEGIADGIDADGALRVLDQEGRRHAIISGSVRLVP